MPRYIDADKLREDILGLPNCYNGFSDTYDKALIIDRIDEQPTADVRENVRAEWLEVHDKQWSGGVFYKCSFCGCGFATGAYFEPDCFNFCPNCGADMRGGQHEKDN